MGPTYIIFDRHLLPVEGIQDYSDRGLKFSGYVNCEVYTALKDVHACCI